MKYLLFCILLSTVLFSCHTDKENNTTEQFAPKLYGTNDEDKAMNYAMETSRKTFGLFETAFKNNFCDTGTASIKLKFNVANGGFEYIWATDLTYENGNYYGIVDAPQLTTEVKDGEKIKINENMIADWMYAEDGILVGGLTLRLIRDRMSPEDREQLDAEFPFLIEN